VLCNDLLPSILPIHWPRALVIPCVPALPRRHHTPSPLPHGQRPVPSSTTQSSSDTCPMPSLRNTPTAMTCPPPHHLAPPPSQPAAKAHKSGKSPTRRPRLLQRRGTAPRAAPQHSTPEARRLAPGLCVTAREEALHRGGRRLDGCMSRPRSRAKFFFFFLFDPRTALCCLRTLILFPGTRGAGSSEYVQLR
jgi:hypothetical protein